MKIAIEGCAHGELEKIYDTIKCLEEKEGFTVDLLICCGDFQSSRNEQDLRCMAVPPKYYNICSFYKYYSGEKVAPVLTIFIGGNHEASNFLQELPYGGWVAPNIYYLGYAGVINIAGLRIGGISGIYKAHDYFKGHFESTPFNDNTKRSVYHVRNLEVFRLKQLSQSINIFMSHDWPTNICNFGNKQQLIKFKPHFENDIKTGSLGSKPAEELLYKLKPEFWFSAHLHCKFAALVPHDDSNLTKFLALDKCLPRRRFLQIIDCPHDGELKIVPSYDLEWLTVLRLTNHLLSVKSISNYMPSPTGFDRWNFKPTDEEKAETLSLLGNNLLIPSNFEKTAIAFVPGNQQQRNISQPNAVSNPQTALLCQKLMIDDPLELLLNLSLDATTYSQNEESFDNNTTFINDSESSIDTQCSPAKVLQLPEPVTKNEFLDDYNDISSSEKIVQNSKMGEVTSKNASKKVSPLGIKRRNASIYNSETCDLVSFIPRKLIRN